jgi:hypothetical protein
MSTLTLKLISSMIEAAVITILDASLTNLIGRLRIFRLAGLSLTGYTPYKLLIFAGVFFICTAILFLNDLIWTTTDLTTTQLQITE